jgi:hypothetical protein
MKYRFTFAKQHQKTLVVSCYSQFYPTKREVLEQIQRVIEDLEKDKDYVLDELSVYPAD